MSDKIKGFTVVLANDICAEEANDVIHAIEMIRGVDVVVPIKTNADDYINRQQVRSELVQKILKTVMEK